MRIPLLAVAASLLLPAAAPAQQRAYAFEEIASDLAYGFCPLFLANQFSLTAPELAERGFGKEIRKQPDARFGEIELVMLARADGQIGFGGAPGKFCTIVIVGEKRDATLSRLRSAMTLTGLDFKSTPPPEPEVPGVSVETFKAPVEGQTLFVQLIRKEGPTPMLVAQLFAMEE